jgi:adenylylsulfate kinase-like enzyme
VEVWIQSLVAVGTIMRMPTLLVIAGPIAAGKSTIAEVLALRMASDGIATANVDLDEVARMGKATDGQSEKLWQLAHRPHAALVGAWLRTKPIGLVIAHGSLYSAEDIRRLARAVPRDTEIILVFLHVTYGTALARVTEDTSRGLSRDPDFLHGAFETLAAQFAESDIEFDYEIDTEKYNIIQIVRMLAGVLGPE